MERLAKLVLRSRRRERGHGLPLTRPHFIGPIRLSAGAPPLSPLLPPL